MIEQFTKTAADFAGRPLPDTDGLPHQETSGYPYPDGQRKDYNYNALPTLKKKEEERNQKKIKDNEKDKKPKLLDKIIGFADKLDKIGLIDQANKLDRLLKQAITKYYYKDKENPYNCLIKDYILHNLNDPALIEGEYSNQRKKYFINGEEIELELYNKIRYAKNKLDILEYLFINDNLRLLAEARMKELYDNK